MRKALIVGINDYPTSPLTEAVADATSMSATLEANGNGDPNFDINLMTEGVTRPALRDAIGRLFEGDPDVALFYFSGHGTITNSGGQIATMDTERNDIGIGLSEIMTLANQSNARNKVIILDCCNSGSVGTSPDTGGAMAQIADGVTILTASKSDEAAVEQEGAGGVFTNLLVEALQGGAADVRGNITPGSLYSYIDEALGAWDQRPVFKTNVSSFAVLRRVEPKVELSILRKLPDYFETPTTQHRLDPSYEKVRSGTEDDGTPEPNPDNVVIFEHLQAMVKASLILPVDAQHMWNAAMENKACRLTAMGKQYWRLAKERKL